MTIEIKGQQFPLHKVFSNDFVFQIPPYQRPYLWGKDQADELLEDLLGALGTGATPIKDLPPYFLGSIVLIKRDTPDAHVVDGQQRLTTLTILLAVLRELVAEPQAKADLTGFLYQKANEMLGLPTEYRLTLRERDAKFFQEFIQNEGGIARLVKLTEPLDTPQANIRTNARHLLERLSARAATTPDLPKRLAQFIVTRCLLVVVWTPDFDSAYRIFSVLNNRGLDLSHTDILKAEVIGAIADKDAAEAFTREWEDTESDLGREAFQELFAHIRMIHVQAKQEGTLLGEFKKRVAPTANPVEFLEQNLFPRARAFGEIREAAFSAASHVEEINTTLRWLRLIDNIDWVPAAIVALTTWRQQPAQALRFLRDLERLAAGLMIIREGVNGRIRRHAAVLRLLEKQGDPYAADAPLQLTTDERDKVKQALDGNIYEANRWVRRMVLLRADWELASSRPAAFAPELSVEHVLPQQPAPSSQWLTWWPQPAEREASLHRLGNLALLTHRKNSQASNFDFDKKVKGYFSARGGVTNFALTVDVMKETQWTPAEFGRRQERLLEKLVQAWRL